MRDPAEYEEIDRTVTAATRVASELERMGPGADPFAAALRASTVPMIITDARLGDNPIVFANDAFCWLTGYARAEILGRNCRFLQDAEADPASVEAIRAAIAAGRSIEIEIVNRRKNGERFWNRLMLEPVRDEQGRIDYFFGSQRDVSFERERLERLEDRNQALLVEVAGRLEAQAEIEARLRFATEAGGLGIWELDPASRILNGSANFMRIVENTEADALAMVTLMDLVHPDDFYRVRTAFERTIETDADLDTIFRQVRSDGEVRWLHFQARAHRPGNSRPMRLAGIAQDVTDRRRAEQRMELSEEALRLATQAAEVGTWDLDLTTGILALSERAKAMFGMPDAVGLTIDDFYADLHPDDLEPTRAAFEAAIDPALRHPFDVEYRTIGRADGTVRWVSAKGRGLFEHGRCYRAIGTSLDISARKQADARQTLLFGLQDRLHSLSEPAAIRQEAVATLGRELGADQTIYATLEPDGASMSLEASFGEAIAFRNPLSWFTVEDLLQHCRGATLIHEDIAPGAHGIRAFVSVPLVRNGRLRACLLMLNRSATAWLPGDVALAEDVAARTWEAVERARAETALRTANETLEQQVADRTEALQANEARLRAIFETSYQFQFLLAIDGMLLDANSTSLAAIDASFAQVVGKPFWETPWFARTPEVPASIRAATESAARGETTRQELVIELPAGQRSFEFTVRPIRDDSGEVVAIVPEAIELTQRRQIEEALRQSQKMEAVGQLTGGLAHDFNNLLTGIGGNLELLESRVESGQVSELGRYIAAARGAVRRAAALTHRLLAFSRRQTLDPRVTNVNRLISEMIDLLRRTVGLEISIELDCAPDLWTTMVDQNQLESALLNLCINSRDAMPKGGRVAINTANIEPDALLARSLEVAPGAFVRIAVSDDGTGMEPEVVRRAFDPFFTTKPIGQGTGLGLSMIYGFARQSGGQVRILSKIGAGTTVEIYLPRVTAQEEAEPVSEASLAGRVGAQKGTVLVVDDEDTVRMLVCELLESLGCGVIEASDGAAALEILKGTAAIDLMISDVGLPGGINGRQVADAARTLRPDLKVLFITGYAEQTVIGKAELDRGMEILTKPFPLEVLSQRVERMIAPAG